MCILNIDWTSMQFVFPMATKQTNMWLRKWLTSSWKIKIVSINPIAIKITKKFSLSMSLFHNVVDNIYNQIKWQNVDWSVENKWWPYYFHTESYIENTWFSDAGILVSGKIHCIEMS